MVELDPIRQRWLRERDTYKRFCEYVAALLMPEIGKRGIYGEVSCREKDLASLLKKVLRKDYGLPYEQIPDKAGVRVVVRFLDDVPGVEEAIVETFTECRREDKSREMKYNEVGYLGIHYQVKLRENQLADCPDFKDLDCEIQIHTFSQNLWAKINHYLTYKFEQLIPTDIARPVYRVSALLEVADTQFSQAYKSIMALPGFEEVRLLDYLERHYYEFTALSYDRQLSLEAIALLSPLYEPPQLSNYDQIISSFVDVHRPTLERIYTDYASAPDRSLFLFQPEAFMILERLEQVPQKLESVWAANYPLPELERLAEIWGKPLH